LVYGNFHYNYSPTLRRKCSYILFKPKGSVRAAVLPALAGSLGNTDFFLDFPIYLQSVYRHSNTISKLCVKKRGRVEECSVAPLRNKGVKTLCGCRGKRVQTKENKETLIKRAQV
jgi:hypothetical protein